MMLDTRCSWVRERRGAVTRTRGVASVPAPIETPFKGSQMQPLPGKEAKLLPEGERASDYGVIFTKGELRTTDERNGTPADVVHDPEEPSVTYKVMSYERWKKRGPVSHFRAVVKLISEVPDVAP